MNQMVKSIQLAIIQAFIVLWGLKFEQMVVIRNLFRKIKKYEIYISY